MISSYPKVWGIGHRAVQELFDGPVLVEEKIDGSQFSFMRDGDKLSFRSKGAEIHECNPERMFALGVQAIAEIAEKLHDGWTYRGEYLAKPKHNTMAYATMPLRNVILFDIETGEGEQYLARSEKEAEAARVELEIVPVLFEGTVTKPEQLLALLERDSWLGGCKIEGVVVKNYARYGADNKVLMGKFVQETFKEANAKNWRACNPALGDIVQRLVMTLRTEARFEKAVQHLRDGGLLDDSPRDIGKLIKQIQADIREEELEFIRKQVTEWAMPKVLRGTSAGVAEWYKERLLKEAFKE